MTAWARTAATWLLLASAMPVMADTPTGVQSAPQFAPSARSLAVSGGPKGNPGPWFTDKDYPKAARRANASGRVSVILSIDTSGRVVGCTITQSSGNAILDETTCTLVLRRGRFTIKRDEEGHAEPYTYAVSTTWVLKTG